MEDKKMLERLRRYEEAVSRARREKQKREEEETNRSVLAMLHVKYIYPELNTSFDESVAIIGSRIEGETKLILNEETPILMKIGSESSSMENYNVTEDFRTIDCNAGIVVTLTVSDEIVE